MIYGPGGGGGGGDRLFHVVLLLAMVREASGALSSALCVEQHMHLPVAILYMYVLS